MNTSLVQLSLGNSVAPIGHINLGLLTQDIKALNGSGVGNEGGNTAIPDPLENHSKIVGRNGSLKANGEPNSSIDLYSDDGKLLQRRFYGEDGKASLDIDFSHGNGDGTHTFPHTHIWDWTQTNPRQ